ncbi:MAG: hypothetical protein MUF09_08670 [Candidatus Nanopelagicales bacterium]|nr:hypothetical protein [Candidatus Nanopelagicales bacterium]
MEARLRRKARGLLEASRRAAITNWAARDDGGLPDEEQLLGAIRQELELLCDGLGDLASVDHEVLFPREPPRRRRPWWS